MLWKIEYFVEGKNLEKALAGAAGIALNMSAPQPVTGAAVVKAGATATKQLKETGSLKTKFMEWIRATPSNARLSTAQMKEYYRSLGSTGRTNVSPLIDASIEEGLLKRISQGQYHRL